VLIVLVLALKENNNMRAGVRVSTRDSVFFWYVLVLRKRYQKLSKEENKSKRGTHLVASSKIKILGFLKMARAMAMRCF
jgi:hypothetical protein